jgi:hypothetical protein
LFLAIEVRHDLPSLGPSDIHIALVVVLFL